MIYVLAVMLFTNFMVMLVVTRGDWLYPAVLVPLAFFLSVLCCIYNIELWGVSLSIQTVLTIALGVLLFSVISYSQYSGKPSRFGVGCLRRIELSVWQKSALVLFFLLVTLLYYRQVQSSFSNLGVDGQDWNDAMAARRQANADTELSEYTVIPTHIVYLYNTMQALSFVLLYVVVNNLFSKQGLTRRDAPLLACMAIYLASVILRSGRLPILELVFAAVLLFWLLWHRVHGWHGEIKLSYIAVAIVGAATLIIVFTWLRDVVGRQNDDDVLTYITSYGGGSIQLFDMYLDSPAPPNVLFGQETFRGVWSALIRHLDIAESYSWQLEFRYSNGVMVGNVYTAFRYWLHDFGYVGMVIMTILYALIYSKFYTRIVSDGGPGSIYVTTLYAFWFSGLTMLPIQDVFCAMDINPGNIYIALCIVFFDWLLVRRPEGGTRMACVSAVPWLRGGWNRGRN